MSFILPQIQKKANKYFVSASKKECLTTQKPQLIKQNWFSNGFKDNEFNFDDSLNYQNTLNTWAAKYSRKIQGLNNSIDVENSLNI